MPNQQIGVMKPFWQTDYERKKRAKARKKRRGFRISQDFNLTTFKRERFLLFGLRIHSGFFIGITRKHLGKIFPKKEPDFMSGSFFILKINYAVIT